MNTHNSFSDFLRYAVSSREVSLIIAKNDTEQQDLIQTLEKEGFKKANKVSDLLEDALYPSKVYLVAGETLRKDLYDFIVQYPTAQIEIFNKEAMKSTTVIPQYKDTSIVLVITKDHLSQVQKHGFDVLSHTGMAYQSS